MDQFTVPQFIEHKAKIVGPLTFQQFVYVGVAAAICFVLYFTIPFFYFIAFSAAIMFFAAILAFAQVGGRAVPQVVKNFFAFTARPKIYLWKKKTGPPPKLAASPQKNQEEIKKNPVPAIVGKSHLKDLSDQIR